MAGKTYSAFSRNDTITGTDGDDQISTGDGLDLIEAKADQILAELQPLAKAAGRSLAAVYGAAQTLRRHDFALDEAGLPAMSLPIGSVAGLPVGAQNERGMVFFSTDARENHHHGSEAPDGHERPAGYASVVTVGERTASSAPTRPTRPPATTSSGCRSGRAPRPVCWRGFFLPGGGVTLMFLSSGPEQKTPHTAPQDSGLKDP